MKMLSCPTSSMISILAPSSVPMVNAPFKRELHVAGAGGFFAGSGNLLGQVGRRDELFRQRYPVIRQEDHLQQILHRRVAMHHIGDAIDQVDDQLGAVIARRRFPADDAGARHMQRLRLLFDAQIAGDDVEREEQLPFVLVHALYLHIEHATPRAMHDPLFMLHLAG